MFSDRTANDKEVYQQSDGHLWSILPVLAFDIKVHLHLNRVGFLFEMDSVRYGANNTI
jgi:hypothetical protein